MTDCREINGKVFYSDPQSCISDGETHIFICYYHNSFAFYDSKKDKQIDTCTGWIASLTAQLEKPGNILVTENNPRKLRKKRFAPLPVQTSL